MNSLPSDASTPLRRLQPYRGVAGSQPSTRSRWSDTPLTVAEVPAHLQAKIDALERAQASAPAPPRPTPTAPPPSNDHQSRIDLTGGKSDQHDRSEPFLSPSGNGLLKELSVVQLLNLPRVETRVKIDEDTIEEYAEAMRLGVQFPPVVVFDRTTEFWLADGCHRVAAADRAGIETIKAEVRMGGRLDAVRFALQANVRHGLRRTNADKRLSVQLALQEFPGESDRAIAGMCGVGNALVSEIRQQVCESNTSTVRRGRDGKHYPATKSPRSKKAPGTVVPRPSEQRSGSIPGGPMLFPSLEGESVDTIANGPAEDAIEHSRSPAIDAPPEKMPPETCVASNSLETPCSEPPFSEAVTDALPASPSTTLSSTSPESLAGVGIQAAVDEPCLVPAGKMLQAVERVGSREALPSDGPDFLAHVRHMVPRVAALLNEYARKFPDPEGRDLSRALSIANAKLQLIMKWG